MSNDKKENVNIAGRFWFTCIFSGLLCCASVLTHPVNSGHIFVGWLLVTVLMVLFLFISSEPENEEGPERGGLLSYMFWLSIYLPVGYALQKCLWFSVFNNSVLSVMVTILLFSISVILLNVSTKILMKVGLSCVKDEEESGEGLFLFVVLFYMIKLLSIDSGLITKAMASLVVVLLLTCVLCGLRKVKSDKGEGESKSGVETLQREKSEALNGEVF